MTDRIPLTRAEVEQAIARHCCEAWQGLYPNHDHSVTYRAMQALLAAWEAVDRLLSLHGDHCGYCHVACDLLPADTKVTQA